MVKTERELKEVIKRYEDELNHLGVHVQKIILYGSYATGTPHQGSDIDLVVISENFNKMNLRERMEILGLAAGRILEPIEAKGYTLDEVDELKGTYLEEVLHTFF